MHEIDESVFRSWKEHPITKVIFEAYVDNITVIDDWLLNAESYLDESDPKRRAFNFGCKQVYQALLDLDAKDFITTKDDEEIND